MRGYGEYGEVFAGRNLRMVSRRRIGIMEITGLHGQRRYGTVWNISGWMV